MLGFQQRLPKAERLARALRPVAFVQITGQKQYIRSSRQCMAQLVQAGTKRRPDVFLRLVQPLLGLDHAQIRKECNSIAERSPKRETWLGYLKRSSPVLR